LWNCERTRVLLSLRVDSLFHDGSTRHYIILNKSWKRVFPNSETFQTFFWNNIMRIEFTQYRTPIKLLHVVLINWW
jgi:hypothetical protein